MSCRIRGECAGVCGERFRTSMYGGKSSSVVSLTRQPTDNREVTLSPRTRPPNSGSMLESRQSPGFPFSKELSWSRLLARQCSSSVLTLWTWQPARFARTAPESACRKSPCVCWRCSAERQGQVVTREELKKHLWPEDTFVDFETGLNTAVSKLRDALSDSAENPRYIETIPRRGYRFISPVEFVNGHHASRREFGQRPKAQPAPALIAGCR